jgi:hypothetical protein
MSSRLPLPPHKEMFVFFYQMLLMLAWSVPVLGAATKRGDVAFWAASTSPNTITFPLQRTPDGGAYLLNVSFVNLASSNVPLKIDLSSSKSWINSPSTYCWNPGNLPGLTRGSCEPTAPESSCYGTPQPISVYYNSDDQILLGKACSADLALGSIEVSCQDLLYVDQNWVQPDEISAGVLGLAYPESFNTQSAQSSPSPGKLVAELQCWNKLIDGISNAIERVRNFHANFQHQCFIPRQSVSTTRQH